MKSVVKILESLIQIPSVNPDGAAETELTGEKACAEWVADFLSNIGAAVQLEEVLPNRPNVIGHFPNTHAGRVRRLLFAPHLDTVSVEGMTIDPFGGEIRDGKIWGRGASDTKGTMAAMLHALQEMAEEGLFTKLGASVSFVGLIGEETGQPGSRHFAKHHGKDYDFAIVGEPTGLDVVYTHKGCVWIEMTVRGKAVHGSTPHLGENAILKLNQRLATILPAMVDRFAHFEDNVLGKPTVNLGMIHGGSRPNIVPDFARATLDIRETSQLHAAGGGRGILEEILAEQGWSEDTELKNTVESRPLKTDPDRDEIRRLQGLGSQLVMAPWFCDAGWLALGGIPSVACGPGDIAQAHTKDEFIAIHQLEDGARFYRRFLETYLSSP